MYKKIIKIALIFSFLINHSNAQNIIVLKNTNYVDSAEGRWIQDYCNQKADYVNYYGEKKIKKDLKGLALLNKLIGVDYLTQISEIIKKASSQTKLKVTSSRTRSGIIEQNQIFIDCNYFNIQVKINVIDTLIINKAFAIVLQQKQFCGTEKLPVPDFVFIKKHLIPYIDSIISMKDDIVYFSNYSFNNIEEVANKNKNNIFYIPEDHNDETQVSQILLRQYILDSAINYYSEKEVPFDFKILIKQSRLKEIEDLLYSVNFLYSVHAMEYLKYLSYIGKLDLSENLKKKMAEIQNNPIPLRVKISGDYFTKTNSYSLLSLTESKIRRKYAGI
jgi:hypothetical protein